MPIELRILTGARGGHIECFEKRVIALGRHLQADLRFDPSTDLDVSAHHAEIVEGMNNSYRVRDSGSTNGTFVNGLRITGEEPLADGDVIWLGAEGPQVQVHMVPALAATERDTLVRRAPSRATTSERVRVAVRRE